MKKLLVLSMMVLIGLGLVSTAQAADSGVVSISVKVASVAILIPDAAADFGALAANIDKVAADNATVSNDGNVSVNYSAQITTAGNWTWDTAATPGVDTACLYVQYTETEPANLTMMTAFGAAATVQFKANAATTEDGKKVFFGIKTPTSCTAGKYTGDCSVTITAESAE